VIAFALLNGKIKTSLKDLFRCCNHSFREAR